MSQQTNLVGQTLGQYQIVELIGEGGMATVYKAWQPALRRYVALKVLAPHLAQDDEFVQRFHREAVSAANLKHNNIVTIYDVGVENGYHYIAMEFIEGASLQERIRSGQAFSPEQVVDVISQVGSALDYAHQRGFIHRDIKPANILVETSGRAVLTDFGIVKALSGSGMTSPLTQAGTVFGTPQYMSPEQVKEEPLDYRSDLYALGIVCYEALSGQVPFDGTTTHSILYAQVNNPPPPLREFAGLEVPAPVEAVIGKMLTKEREGRYNSADEFARDLAQAVTDVWPDRLRGETAVVGRAPAGGAEAGREPAGATAATVREPARPPAPPPAAVPARRSRWPLIVGVVAAGTGALLILALVAVLVVGPEDVMGWLGLNPLEEKLAEAQESLGAGRYDEAMTTFKEVLEKEADNVEALRGVGEAYAAQEQWQQAAEWYEKWTQVEPGGPEAWLKLGWASYYMGEYERAIAGFTRLIALEPMDVEGHKGKGLSYYALEQYGDALEPTSTWVEMEATDLNGWLTLGWIYYWLEDYENAVPPLRRVTEENPDETSGWKGLGGAYYKLGRFKEAEQPLLQWTTLDPNDPTAYRLLGHAYVEMGSSEQAISAYAQWVRLEPDSAAAHRQLGWAYYGAEEWDNAVASFSRALKIEESGNAYRGLGRAYYDSERYAEAVSAFEKYRDYGEPGEYDPHVFLGWAYYQVSRYDEAIESFENALSIESELPNAYYGLGRCYAELGQDDEAITQYSKAAELYGDNPAPYEQMGWSYFRLEEFELALEAFQNVIALDSRSVEGHYGIARSYGRLGDCAKAVEHYEIMLELSPGDDRAIKGIEGCDSGSQGLIEDKEREGPKGMC